MRLKIKVAVLLMFTVTATAFGQNFNNAQYLKNKGTLRFADNQLQFVNKTGAPEFAINESAVQSLSYSRTSKGDACYTAPPPVPHEKSKGRKVAEGAGEFALYGLFEFTMPALMVVAIPASVLAGRQHCLTIGYAGPDGGEQSATVRIDKRNYRQVIAALEAGTGKTVEMPPAKASNKK